MCFIFVPFMKSKGVKMARFGACTQVLLLIALCILQVQTQNVKLKNWLQISKDNWPKEDPLDPKGSFILFHRENVHENFSFKKDIFKDKVLVGSAILTLRYWANAYGQLRSVPEGKEPRHVDLDRTSEWTQKSIDQLTLEQWNNFSLFPSDDYTLAIKNVQLKYTEKDHHETVVLCKTSGCPEIFNRPMAYSSQYVASAPIGPAQFVPYRGELENEPYPTSYLLVEKPKTNPNHDFCVEFINISPQLLRVSVSVSTTSKSTLGIEFVSNGREDKICASTLTNDLPNVPGLVFRLPEIKGENQNLDSNIIGISNTTSEVDNQIIIQNGIFRDEQLKEKFFDASKNLFTIGDRTIEFKIADLQAAKNFPSKSPNYYLRSKWFRAPSKVKNQIYLTLKSEGLNLEKDFLTSASLIIVSPSQPAELIEKKLSEINTTAVNVFSIVQSVDYFQLIIRIKLDYNKIKDEKDFSLKLSQLTVNDPCLEVATGEERNCNQKVHQGHCEPSYDTFTFECVCEPGFSKLDSCKSIDFCSRIKDRTTGETYETFCKRNGQGCVNKADNFECKCENDKLRWDVTFQDCIEKEITPCGENQFRQKVKGQYVCDCDDGYLKIENACVLYNPCLDEHRKARNIKPENKLCTDIKAECTVKRDSPDGYECICGSDYFNQFALKTHNANCIQKRCNNCQHYCELKDRETREYECKCYKDYNPNGDRCDPDGKIDQKLIQKCYNETNKIEGAPEPFLTESGSSCRCVPGFIFDASRKVCVVDFHLVAQKLYGCDKLEINQNDKKLGCACWELGLKMDQFSRSCLHECSEEQSKKCAQSNAICAYNPSLKRASCKCKDGNEIAFAPDNSKPTDWTCVSKCSLLDRPELYDQKCTGHYQHCDPSQLMFIFLFMDGLQRVFLYNSSSLIDVQSAHCQCEVGFSMHNRDRPQQSCELSETPIRYIRDMQFDLASSAKSDEDKKRFTEKVLQAIDSLIISLFNSHPVETKCYPKSDKVHCDIGFATVLSKEQIRLDLKTNCYPVKDQKEVKKCLFFTAEMMKALEPAPIKFSNILVCDLQMPTNVKIEDLDYCANPDRCRANYDLYDSQCRTKIIKTQHVFECICDPNIFDIHSTIPKVFKGEELEMESCQLKNLCADKQNYGCADPTAYCNLMVVYDETARKYTPKTFCTCPETKLVLPSRDRLCKNLHP